jgi:hypothetical protein
MTKSRGVVSSCAAHLSLLSERDVKLQSAALSRLNALVDEFWPEIYEAIESMYICSCCCIG